jgi:steroid delta-isomerase-like uncharacterized protein
MAEVAIRKDVSRLVREMVDALNSHDVERLMSITSSDYEGVDVNQALPQLGKAEARLAVQSYFAAFPDLAIVEYETIIQGSRAVLVWKACGTHKGVIMHIPPTGRRVAVRGTSTLHIQDGAIKKAVHVWDVAAMLREIGLLPEL